MTKMDGYTTLAFVAIDENGERDFEFHRGSDGAYKFSSIDLSKISGGDIIHFGSATGFLEGELKNTYFKLLKYANENNVFISFDPNYRDALITKDKLEGFIKDCKSFIKNSDFIKLSDEELKLIKKNVTFERWKEIIAYANKVGAITCTSYGAIDSMPTSKEVDSN